MEHENSSPSPSGADLEQRLQDLATFADGLVHDLRNPLGVIRNNLYLLRQRLPEEDARLLRSVERIDDQVTVATRILDGLQVFYRGSNPSLQRINLNDLVRNVADSVSLPEGVALEYALAEDLGLVSGDPQLLEPALRALLRNAVEALLEGGTIMVGTAREGDCVRVTVRDTGAGMPEDVLARALEPLYTTRRGHSGLGLALVDRVARGHGGRAFVASTPGEGTTAAVELPAG